MVYTPHNSDVPQAFIATRKNRLKNYGDKIYLKDGQTFQVELFNPLHTNVLAKINVNGNSIGSGGIIVRPGERVFLERYLDESKLFEFKTYDVPKDDRSVDHAIRNNGLIEVYFYEEKIHCDTWKGMDWYQPSNARDYTHTHGSYDIIGMLNSYDTQICNTSFKDTKETGRIEKGSYSDQCLNEVYMDFQSNMVSSYTFRLLPESEQVTSSIGRIRHYCEGCGQRVRSKNANFCTNCGCKVH